MSIAEWCNSSTRVFETLRTGAEPVLAATICRCAGRYTDWSQTPAPERDCVVEHVSGTNTRNGDASIKVETAREEAPSALLVSALSKPILPITCSESEVTITSCTDVESWATKMPIFRV